MSTDSIPQATAVKVKEPTTSLRPNTQDSKPLKDPPSQAANINSLPIEILFAIAKTLHHYDIIAHLGTCHRMKDCMEPCLYRRIVLGWRSEEALAKLIHNLKFRPELAQDVTSLAGSMCRLLSELYQSVSWPLNLLGSWRWQKRRKEEELQVALSNFFQAMPNLRRVCFRTFHGDGMSSIIRPTFLPNVTLTALEVNSVFCPDWRHASTASRDTSYINNRSSKSVAFQPIKPYTLHWNRKVFRTSNPWPRALWMHISSSRVVLSRPLRSKP